MSAASFEPGRIQALCAEISKMAACHYQERAPLDREWEAFETAAYELVREGRQITGRPFYQSADAIGRICVRGDDVRVEVNTYRGEGMWEREKPDIVFPVRWLSIPEAEWKAELRAAVADRGRRKVAADEQRKANEAKRQDEAERQQYEALRAKFEAAARKPSEV